MQDIFERTKILTGPDNFEKIQKSHIILFGVGGVGSYTAEALCRAGIGEITLVDGDEYSYSNLNRQLFATLDTVGTAKTLAAKKRLVSINPDIVVHTKESYVTKENVSGFFTSGYTFCADAIDDTAAKVAIALVCKEKNIPLIASMGTGNKISTDKFTVTDISKTQYCPLCRTMRKKYRDAGLGKVTVLYSPEQPLEQKEEISAGDHGTRRPPASISFVPAVAGLKIAEYIIRQITGM